MPKMPLTKDEQNTLLEHAKAVGDFWGVNVHDTVLIYLETGMHTSVLTEGLKPVIIHDGPKRYIQWNRPKKSGRDALVRLSVPKSIADIVEAYFSKELPRYRQFYNFMFDSIKKHMRDCGVTNTSLLEVSPLALRHTFALNRLNDGMTTHVLKQFMNCSEKTLDFYTKLRGDMLDEYQW